MSLESFRDFIEAATPEIKDRWWKVLRALHKECDPYGDYFWPRDFRLPEDSEDHLC